MVKPIKLLSCLVIPALFFQYCTQKPEAPPGTPATQAPAAEPEFFAGHSITDSIGEISDHRAHYDTVARILDPFIRKDVLGPAKQRLGHYGIDVSNWQKDVEWAGIFTDSVPHPITFVFVKATQGSNLVDAHFAQNWEQAQKHKFKVGAYHFYRYKDDPVEQAQHYIRNVSLKKGNLLPVVDVELDCKDCTEPGLPPAQMIANLKKYIATIEAHYKVKPLIYTYEGFYHQYLKGHFPEHLYWMAYYKSQPPVEMSLHSKQNVQNKQIVCWQFTDSGNVRGIRGSVDMSFLPAQFEHKILF